MPPLNRVKSFSSRPAHLPSTCSRVTRTAATNSARWSKPSLNEKEVQNAKAAPIQTQKTSRHCGAPSASHRRDYRRLRRSGRAEHETFAGVADRAPPARRRGRRNHRIQRDQNASSTALVFASAEPRRRSFRRNKTANDGVESGSCAKNHREDANESF